jgi:dolichol-phosphate mannosyltransferase
LHSIVVPVFNEEEGIALFHARAEAAMRAIGEPFEIIYVDDGSRDTSWGILSALARDHSEVRLIRFSRNFGHQIAITAGMERASGDTTTVIDADLQDPPELIADMIQAWRDGADIVYAVRTSREGESTFKKGTASAFYRLLHKLSPIDVPLDAGDFRLLSRRALDALLSMPERHRYVRGMVAWLGFPTAAVEYSRAARAAGSTKYRLSTMMKLATDGIISLSMRPLQLATWLGVFVSLSAFVSTAWLLIARELDGRNVEGLTWLTVLVLLLSGVQLLTIGALGEYIGRAYEEARHRPLYVVQDEVGFESVPSEACGVDGVRGRAETPEGDSRVLV